MFDTGGHNVLYTLTMKNTYSIKEAQSQLPRLVREAEAGNLGTITRHEKAVAYVMGAEEFASLIETMEILANLAAMAAIAEAEAGNGPVYTLDDIPD